MGYKNRYTFIRKTYPNTMVIFKKSLYYSYIVKIFLLITKIIF